MQQRGYSFSALHKKQVVACCWHVSCLPAARRRISEGKKGHAVSAETRRKLSAANRGHTPTKVTRCKLSKYCGPASSQYRKDIPTDEIVRLYASGLTVYDIAHRFRCGPCLVTDRLRKSSINIRGPHPEQNKQ